MEKKQQKHTKMAMVFMNCSFKEGVNKLEFNGSDSVIKGYDSEGKEIFSHTYHYVGIEEVRGLYEFEK